MRRETSRPAPATRSAQRFAPGAAGCTTFSTYDPRTQTYRGFDGRTHECRPGGSGLVLRVAPIRGHFMGRLIVGRVIGRAKRLGLVQQSIEDRSLPGIRERLRGCDAVR